MMTSDSPDAPTADVKERLIQAGLEIFAERGLADAGVDEICSRAGADSGAVDEHFGDKKSFFTEMLFTSLQGAMARRRMPRLVDDPEHPEAVLGKYIHWLFDVLYREVGDDGPLGQLMRREISEPTGALDQILQHSLAPAVVALREIVGAVLGDDVPPEVAYGAFQSVLGQVIHYRLGQPYLARVQALVDAGKIPGPGPESLTRDLDTLARQITEFSIGGLRRTKSVLAAEPA